MSEIQAVERLTAITKIQAEVINDLFLLLMQHITAEEAGRLPVVDKINLAADLRRDVDL